MFERILVPLDGSQTAEAVLSYIPELAQKLGARMLLLRVVPTLGQIIGETAGGEDTGDQIALDVSRERAESEHQAAEAYVAQIQQRLQGQGLGVDTAVVEGEAGPAIVQQAEDQGVSIIAMATHGRSGLGRLLMGSVADEVVRHTSIPVLLVRPAG